MSDDTERAIADLDARLTALGRALSAIGPAGGRGSAAGGQSDAPSQIERSGPTPPPGVASRPVPASSSEGLARLAGWTERLGRLVAELAALRSEVDEGVTRPGRRARRQPRAPVASGQAATKPAVSQRVWPTPVPVPVPYDRMLTGRVNVDAGPFSDITAVSNFDRALQRIPAAHGITLTGFADDRARFAVQLGEPVALGRAIRGVVPFNFAMFDPGDGTLAINLTDKGTSRRQVRRPA
jgi:hypothetical protein